MSAEDDAAKRIAYLETTLADFMQSVSAKFNQTDCDITECRLLIGKIDRLKLHVDGLETTVGDILKTYKRRKRYD